MEVGERIRELNVPLTEIRLVVCELGQIRSDDRIGMLFGLSTTGANKEGLSVRGEANLFGAKFRTVLPVLA